MEEGARIKEQLRAYLEDGKHPLRPRQIEVIHDIIKHLDKGQTSGYIKRPTGTGKTVTFSSVVKALQGYLFEKESETDGIAKGALILVPRAALAEQTYDTLIRKDLFGFDPEEIGVFYSHAKPTDGRKVMSKDGYDVLDAPILVMTYQSYISLRQDDLIAPEDRPVVMLDEVDQAKGDVTSPIMRELVEKSYTLGWSATDRFVGDGKLQTVGDVLFDGQPPIHETSIEQAIYNGEIAPVKNVTFKLDLESGTGATGEATGREYSAAERKKIVDQKGRDEAAIKAISTFTDPDTNLAFKDMNQIWFCSGVTHATRVADKLNQVYGKGYAVAVSGKTPKEDGVDKKGRPYEGLKTILEKHRTGEIPVIVNADLLIRGFDAPATQLCVMLRPTRSAAMAEQAGGRVLRLDPNNEDKLAYVVNFFDEDMKGVVPFSKVAGGVFITKKGKEKAGYAISKPKREIQRKLDLGPVEEAAASFTPVYKEHEVVDLTERVMSSFDASQVKPAEYLSAADLSEVASIPYGRAAFVFQRLRQEFDEAQEKNERTNNPKSVNITIVGSGKRFTISSEDMGLYLVKGNVKFCIKNTHLEELKEFLSPLAARPKSFYTVTAARQYFTQDQYSQNNIRNVYQKLEEAFDAYTVNLERNPEKPYANEIRATIDDHVVAIPIEDIGRFKGNSFAIHKKHMNTIAIAAGVPAELLVTGAKPDYMLSEDELAKEDGIDGEKVKNLYRDLIAKFKNAVRKKEDTITLKRHSMNLPATAIPISHMGLYTHKGESVVAIDRMYLPHLKQSMEESPEIPSDGLSARDMISKYGNTSRVSPIFRALKKKYDARDITSTPDHTIEVDVGYGPFSIPLKDIGYYRAESGYDHFMIKDSHLPNLCRAAGMPLANDVIQDRPDLMIDAQEFNIRTRIPQASVRNFMDKMAASHAKAVAEGADQFSVSMNANGSETYDIPVHDAGWYMTRDGLSFAFDPAHLKSLVNMLQPSNQVAAQSIEPYRPHLRMKHVTIEPPFLDAHSVSQAIRSQGRYRAGRGHMNRFFGVINHAIRARNIEDHCIRINYRGHTINIHEDNLVFSPDNKVMGMHQQLILILGRLAGYEHCAEEDIALFATPCEGDTPYEPREHLSDYAYPEDIARFGGIDILRPTSVSQRVLAKLTTAYRQNDWSDQNQLAFRVDGQDYVIHKDHLLIDKDARRVIAINKDLIPTIARLSYWASDVYESDAQAMAQPPQRELGADRPTAISPDQIAASSDEDKGSGNSR